MPPREIASASSQHAVGQSHTTACRDCRQKQTRGQLGPLWGVRWAYLDVLDAINDAQILAAILFCSLLLDAGGCLEGGNVYLHRTWTYGQKDKQLPDYKI